MTTTETRKFEAEVQELLGLMIHSLYKHREIFLRELISNASDALDRLRFEALQRPELVAGDERLRIELEPDRAARTLTVSDNGVGMSREELVSNLGTIARSGTRRFLQQAREAGAEQSPELIGQFGVGFYSSFMVAERVTVETRRAGAEGPALRWTSEGRGEYELEELPPGEGPARGTRITLHLRSADDDEAPEDADDPAEFLEEWRLRDVVRRYSDFVEHPVELEVERPVRDEEGKPIEGKTERKTEVLNSRKPLWQRPKSELTDEDYAEFYRHLTHDGTAPLETIHFKAEGTQEYTALLFVPDGRPLDLFDGGEVRSRISLYVKRVLIVRECEDLLPPWLRFVRGVVDSADLPLNVSRDVLQQNRAVRQIRKRLVTKVLEALADLLRRDRDKYTEFWGAFGALLKEGIYAGEDDDQRISKIALFASTDDPDPTTLGEYVARMPKEQDALWYLAGADRETLERSPHLEALRKKGFEVLFLTDPIDEFMLQRLASFDGKPLKPADRALADLESASEKEAREAAERDQRELLSKLEELLEDDVSEVRFSSRLTESPAVLVTPPGGLTPHMRRILRAAGQDVPDEKRALELNPDHALTKKLAELHAADPAGARVADFAELLHAQARLAEGQPPRDPVRFSKLLAELMLGG